jgi:uncharacterized protein
MKRLGENPLHTLMLLTELPGRWAAWQIVPVPLTLATAAGLVCAHATGNPLMGWILALGLLALFLADWAWLASLPCRGLSFGPVQPTWLGLSLLRVGLAWAVVPLAAHWPWPVLIGLALVQIFISLLMAYGTQIEPFRLQVTKVEISSDKMANPGTSVRIVQLSDLHVERLTRRERALPLVVADLAPDLIILNGDFLNTSYQRDLGALADLRVLLAQLEAPGGIYAVWGTPEVDLPTVLRPLLADLGIILLEDEAIAAAVGGHTLWIVGVTCTRDLSRDGSSLRAVLAAGPPRDFTVLLYHTPDLMPQAASLGVDLYLAGHTHGGQWRLPWFGAILTSSRYWKRYEAGHYREGASHLYVSRGLGMEGFGMPRARFFCPPEVVSITLTGSRKS